MTDGWIMDAFGDGSDLPDDFGADLEPPEIPCLVFKGSCGVVRGASSKQKLFHFECVETWVYQQMRRDDSF